MKTYALFLRGINVGGHHKVPMGELRELLEKSGLQEVTTLLNSGNILFQFEESNSLDLERRITSLLETHFGFPIPTILREIHILEDLWSNDPFEGIQLTKDIRFYISFLKNEVEGDLSIPWQSDDASFRILEKRGGAILSVLDLSIGKTPKAMEILEKIYKKENITTRNWNTIIKIKNHLTK